MTSRICPDFARRIREAMDNTLMCGKFMSVEARHRLHGAIHRIKKAPEAYATEANQPTKHSTDGRLEMLDEQYSSTPD